MGNSLHACAVCFQRIGHSASSFGGPLVPRRRRREPSIQTKRSTSRIIEQPVPSPSGREAAGPRRPATSRRRPTLIVAPAKMAVHGEERRHPGGRETAEGEGEWEEEEEEDDDAHHSAETERTRSTTGGTTASVPSTEGRPFRRATTFESRFDTLRNELAAVPVRVTTPDHPRHIFATLRLDTKGERLEWSERGKHEHGALGSLRVPDIESVTTPPKAQRDIEITLATTPEGKRPPITLQFPTPEACKDWKDNFTALQQYWRQGSSAS